MAIAGQEPLRDEILALCALREQRADPDEILQRCRAAYDQWQTIATWMTLRLAYCRLEALARPDPDSKGPDHIVFGGWQPTEVDKQALGGSVRAHALGDKTGELVQRLI